MSATITHKDQQPCCHHHGDVRPSRMDAIIARYEALIVETEKEKRKWEEKALNLEGVAKESNATANKNEILHAISEASMKVNPISDEFIQGLFD